MTPSFRGLRVLALESRRAREMATLISAYGGEPIIAPAMREVPIEQNVDALATIDAIVANEFDLLILLTGVGTRALLDLIEKFRGSKDAFVSALRRMKIACRGPKPAAVMRDLRVPVWLVAPEPNTWRELMVLIDHRQKDLPLQGRRVAVQEYGVQNPELIAALRQRGAQVTRVPVYRWALPEDLGPLQAAVRSISKAEVDVVLFTTATQVVHLLQVAREMGEEDALRAGLRLVVVGSIGPTTSEELREQGLEVDMEPSHPKMGILVREAAAQAGELLVGKTE
jgi:uroporphyrinogen-III synthase